MTRVAVIGCTHAGVFATQSILQAHPDWSVDVFERNDTVSFLSCGIALWAGNHVSDPKKMFYSSPEALSEVGARMHMKTEVLRVDVRAKTLTAKPVNALDEQAQKYSFDKLVITTGSIAAVPPIPGVRADNVLLCKTWRDGLHIKEHTSQAHSVVVVGAGYIGAELAEQLNLRGVKVTLIDALDRVLANNYDEPITKLVEHAYQSHGVKLALGQRVTEFRQDPAQPGGTQGVTVVTQAGEYHADYAIIAAGFLPATQLVRNQLDTLDNGAIIVDEYMRTSVPDVYAAGDSATVLYNPTGKLDYIPLATNAVRQGLLIGQNIDEPTRAYMGTQATSAVQLYDLSLASTGLTEAGATKRAVQVHTTELVEDYRPAFMLTTAPVTCLLSWDAQTRLVKGAQFASGVDISGAANTVSLAIQSGYTVDDLANVDLLFQPNFDQPVHYVGAVAMKAVAEANAAAD